jgi:hypothetical protein
MPITANSTRRGAIYGPAAKVRLRRTLSRGQRRRTVAAASGAAYRIERHPCLATILVTANVDVSRGVTRGEHTELIRAAQRRPAQVTIDLQNRLLS